MKQEDISVALHVLGYWIERMEKEGVSDKTLMPFKHSYLRINWWMVKNPSYSHSPILTEEELQVLHEGCHSISPTWLPCRKLLSEGRGQPCTSHDKICRCSQILQCELEDSFPS